MNNLIDKFDKMNIEKQNSNTKRKNKVTRKYQISKLHKINCHFFNKIKTQNSQKNTLNKICNEIKKQYDKFYTDDQLVFKLQLVVKNKLNNEIVENVIVTI